VAPEDYQVHWVVCLVRVKEDPRCSVVPLADIWDRNGNRQIQERLEVPIMDRLHLLVSMRELIDLCRWIP
jgi:hypothetical protein